MATMLLFQTPVILFSCISKDKLQHICILLLSLELPRNVRSSYQPVVNHIKTLSQMPYIANLFHFMVSFQYPQQ